MPRNTDRYARSPGSARDQVQFSVAFETILVARLWRARFLERAKAQGQTDARWTALYMIADAGNGISQSDLTERLGVSGPSLARLVDAMERQGLISRAPAPDDRRAKTISIKPKGREVLADIDRTAAEMRDELFEGVSDRELETMLKVLHLLSRRLEPRRRSPAPKRR